MSYDNHPEEFNIGNPHLSMLVLNSARAMDQYQLNGKADPKYEQSIERLSKMFFELTKTPMIILMCHWNLF